MTPERWKQIEALYHDARALPAADRSGYLSSASAGDEQLQREVERLLSQPPSNEGWLAGHARDVAGGLETHPALVNKTLGSYEMQALIGVGGMGEVYRARDLKLGREVAIKVLPSAFTSDPGRLARFDREARMLAALNHPNICAIYGFEHAGEIRFLVLELVDGETLAELLVSARARTGGLGLPDLDALSIARQIARALDFAHEHGIVHRDLKPANVKVTSDGAVKVLDFGLAKATTGDAAGADLEPAPSVTHNGTIEGALLGTPAYMSPEQARGKPVDKRTDIWAFGCVLYEMLTGRAAFHGDTLADTIAKVIEREPDWSALPRSTPEPVRQLLRACLVKDSRQRLQDIGDVTIEGILSGSGSGAAMAPETRRVKRPVFSKERDQRYQTAAALREDLVRLKSQPDAVGSGTVTPVGPTPDRPSPWRRRLLAMAAVIAVALSAGAAYQLWLREFGRTSTNATAASLDSVAVLPFAATGSGVDAEYLADGITEALINRLAQVSGLRVAPRSVVFRLKGRGDAEARQIGRDLNVASVVTGRVAVREGRVEIGVELTSVDTGLQVWSRKYDRPAADLLEVQDEAATEVGGRLALGARLGAKATKKLAATGLTSDPEAYQLYLHGRYHSHKGTIPGNKTAIEYFQRAVQKDPRFALAYAALAESYLTMVAYWADPILSAKSAADEALRIEPNLAEAHVALGDIRAWLYWDWTTAQRELERAIVLDPDSAVAHSRYAMVLATIGRVPDAIAEIKQAQDLDPRSASINSDFGWHLLNFGRYIDAVAQFQRAIGLDAESISAHHGLGIAYSLIGRHDQAVTELNEALRLSENSPVVMGHLGAAYARQQRPADAQRVLRDLQNLSLREYVPSSAIAMVYEAMGDRTRAFDWLDKAIDEHDFSVAQLSIAPWFRSLHDDARFEKLLVKLNLSRPDRAKDAP